MKPGTKLDGKQIERYFLEKFGSRVKEVRELGKGFHGTGFLARLADGRKFVFKTLKGEALGHEYPADRAQVLLSAHASFNKLPGHVRSYDVGAITGKGAVSIGEAKDFFLVMEEVRGREYWKDMNWILEVGKLEKSDLENARLLADYLAGIHGRKHDSPSLYMRKVREAVTNNELMMGVIDIYPRDVKFASSDELTGLVKKTVDWWNRIKWKTHRLRAVHGDFYPGNILFSEKGELIIMDRSRGEYGEPAEDVACILINYIFYALRQRGKFEGPFAELSGAFLERYLEKTKDEEILSVIAPFFASRAVVVCCPPFYPQVPDGVRRKMFDFAWNLLDEEKFELGKINRLMIPKQ